jgi:hypothetical protein
MSLWGLITGSDAADAARQAAADTYKKQQQATSQLTQYGDTLPAIYAKLAQSYSPYASAGNSSLAMLMNGLGLNGAQGSQDFINAYRATPGYQAGLDQGTNAVNRTENARSMLNSGSALKALQRFGQDYEDQKSQQFLSNLSGLANTGLGATQAQVGTESQGIQGQLATRNSAYGGNMQSAGTIGQGLVAGAQSEQNAFNNLLGAATYLGGAALGGGFKLPGFGTTSIPSWPVNGTTAYRPTPWG